MRFHDALLYRRRLAEYYANCSPAFPLLPPQLRRSVQSSYDPKLFSAPSAGAETPPIADGNAAPTVGVGMSGSHGGNQSASLLSRGGDQAGMEQPVPPPPSMPLFGALFSYLHPSLAAAAAAAMAHWYLGGAAPSDGGTISRPPHPRADPLMTQRSAGKVPDWAARLRTEDLLRLRSSSSSAAVTGQASSSRVSDQYVELDDRSTRSQQHSSSPDISTSSDVPFRPYLPVIRRPTQLSAAERRRSPVDAATAEPVAAVVAGPLWDRSDAVSSESKTTPDLEERSNDSVGSAGGGGAVEAGDGRNSSELVNMERMVHGLKHVQTAAIEELSKVADSY